MAELRDKLLPSLRYDNTLKKFGAADVINVKDFGAVGDNSADDTSAIEAAIDAAPAGGTLLFPRGRYKITDELAIDKSLTIEGIADIVQHDTEAVAFSFDGSSGTQEPGGGIAVRIRDMRIDGGTVGVNLAGPLDPRISCLDNVYFINQTFAGIRLQTSALGMVFRACNFLVAGHGVYTDLDATAPNGDLIGNTTWINCSWNGGGAGYYAMYAAEPSGGSVMPNILMLNPVFQSLNGRALYMRQCNIRMIEPHFEACCIAEDDGEDIHIEGLVGGGDAKLTLEGGTFAAPVDDKWTRLKVIGGQIRVFIRNTQFAGVSNNILDADGQSNCFFGYESMGFGGYPTIANGSWSWINGPV